jgi:uncharacterized repeat protein (TIGR01451 family)
MLQKKLWLAGAVGAVCLAIFAGMAQDQSSVKNPVQKSDLPQESLRGVTLIPGNSAARSRSLSGSDIQDPVQDVRRYQRTQTSPGSEPVRTTGIRNYHKELFGTDPPAAAHSRSPGRPLELTQVNPAISAETSAERFGNRGSSRIQQTGFAAPQVQSVSPSATEFVETPVVTRGVQQVVPADYRDAESRKLVVPVSSVQPAASVLPANLDASLTQQPGTGPAAIEVISATEVKGGSATAIPTSQPLPGAPKKLFSDFRKGLPQIETEWRKKGDINVGQKCELELIVKNTGTAMAAYLEIAAEFPQTVQVTETSPTPFDDGTWKIPGLAPGKEHRILITMIPLERGEIAPNANVKFTTATAAVFTVEEPMLALVVKGPEQVKLGESVSHVVTISNPGTGVANNVSVMVTLPKGLEHASQRNRLMMDLGSLSPGEKRNVRLALTAAAGGEQLLVIDAKAGAELAEQSQSLVTVLAPKLEIAVTGPSLRYLGRDARYSVSVANKGAATTDNVRAMYAVPEGFEFQSATRGGKCDESRRIVSWFVGSVKSNETIELSLKLRPVKPGEFTHAARVVSEHGEIAEAQAETRIEGTASLLLKVADLDDPVETGKETAYEITIQNDGSKEAQNVGLSIELPVGVKLVDVQGPSTHIAENGLVVFKSLPKLPPGKTATYRLFVRGMEEGNQRLRARLTSDSIHEPLTIEELTRFYAE